MDDQTRQTVEKLVQLSDWPPDDLDQEISDLFGELRMRLGVSQDDCHCPDGCCCRCGAAGQAVDAGPDDTDTAWGY